MTPANASLARAKLEQFLPSRFGGINGEPLTKQEFIRWAWDDIARIVHFNKDNELIQQSVRAYPDLIPRTFTILTVLHGVFTSPPKRNSVPKDFIAMLGEDILEEELRVWEYAKVPKEGSYFPELVCLRNYIHEIYELERFNQDALPPRPYHAYAMFVLNSNELLGKKMSHEELFGFLSVGDTLIRKTLRLAHHTLGTEPIKNSPNEVVARRSPPTPKDPDGKVEFFIRKRKLP